LPPVFDVVSFTFAKVTDEENLDSTENYEWTIKIKIYWQSITNEQLWNLSYSLWKACFGIDQQLNLDYADQYISKRKQDLTKSNLEAWKSINAAEITNLDTIHWFILEKNVDQDKKSNYKKAEELFSVYRTLNENNLCLIR
jgi:hypothetical protein